MDRLERNTPGPMPSELFQPPGDAAVAWGENNVHVWFVDLTYAEASLQQCRVLLSTDERATAERFHFEHDRNRYSVTRATLRRLLSKYLECDPREIAIRYSEHGKPELADTDRQLHFNVSHSRDVAVVAVAQNLVGIDIERAEAKPSLERLVRRLFSPHDTDRWINLDHAARIEQFYRSWTWKESYLKATGRGFAGSLDGFTLQLPDEALKLPAAWHEPDDQRPWSFTHFTPCEGFAGAIALQSAVISPRFYYWK